MIAFQTLKPILAPELLHSAAADCPPQFLTKFNWIEEASGVRLSTPRHLRSRWGCSQLPKNVHQLANLRGLLEMSMALLYTFPSFGASV